MIQDLLHISSPFAVAPDLIQGSGGNTSVKQDGRMLIKASGYRLCDMSNDNGFVAVDAKAIAAYFSEKKFLDAANADSDLKAYTISHILDADKSRLPSMETGFHSVLQNYVIHTHSVYSNLVNCAANAEPLLKAIFPAQTPAWIPYCNPGFYLSNSVYELVKTSAQYPKVIFLQNHGLITSSNNMQEAIELNHWVNDTIKAYFTLSEAYPVCSIERRADSVFSSKTNNIADWLSEFNLSQELFSQTLFPDQTVFFKNRIHIGETENPAYSINIHPGTYAVTYFTNEKEALAMDETLTAFLFILYHLKTLGLKPQFIAPGHIDYINNMDMEQYRKSLMNNQ